MIALFLGLSYDVLTFWQKATQKSRQRHEQTSAEYIEIARGHVTR